MKTFIMKKEHYCPKMKKNIVLEHRIMPDERTEDICLNSHECRCGEQCQNKLLDMEIKIIR